MGWEMSLWVVVPYQSTVHSNPPRIAFGAFYFFLEMLLLLSAASSGPLLSGSSLEFPLFLGDTPVFCLLRFANWFLFREIIFPLGETSNASCFFKITTNQLLLGKDFFFLDLDKEETSGAFSFSPFWVFYLSFHAPLVYY